MSNANDILSKSKDYQAMLPYWQKVEAINAGVEAMRDKQKTFLPQFPKETPDNYQYRLRNSKFTNIYSDIVENLASKPFTKEVSLSNMANLPPMLGKVVEDIDGSGSHLHIFANEIFFAGIHDAITWILVDFPVVPEGATLEDERRLGIRPYWVHIQAKDLLWVESATINGKEQFVYVKIHEPYTSQDSDGKEIIVDRVRVLKRDKVDGGYGPAHYEIWEDSSAGGGWSLIKSGPITIGVIPLVPFYTGRRKGSSWLVTPPMRNVADLQIEHYQAETNLKNAKELTAYPMFVVKGCTAPVDDNGRQEQITLGPSSVLWLPPIINDTSGGATIPDSGFVEIAATSLAFLSSEIDKIETQMRELGRQPLTIGSTGLTQVAAAFASQKAASAVQSWAFFLKDALENAFVYTGMWLNETVEPTVYINTDFAIEIGDNKAPDVLLAMVKEGLISTETFWLEMKRRGILSPEFEAKEEIEKLLNETPTDSVDDMQAAIAT